MCADNKKLRTGISTIWHQTLTTMHFPSLSGRKTRTSETSNMNTSTHIVSHHQQLLAPEVIQVLHNLHVSSSTRTHEACPKVLHTLAVRPPTCAVSNTPATPSALLLSLLTPDPEPTASVWSTCQPRVHVVSLWPQQACVGCSHMRFSVRGG